MNEEIDFCLSLLKKITKFLENEETVARYRVSASDFTRKRSLSFKRLVLFMLQFGKSSIQYELDKYFEGIINSVTKSAFSQQRKKLKPSLFIALNELLLSIFYTKQKVNKYKGHRVIALDGSTIQLSTSKDLEENFGVFRTRTENGRKVIMGRISAMYDVLNNQVIEAKLDHYNIGELTLAEQQIEVLLPNDILLGDRAYAAFWMMSKLHHSNKNFVIRLKANRWKIGKQFLKTNLKEQIVTVSPSNEAKARCKEKGIKAEPIQLRLVKARIKGEDAVLITNLLDKKTYQAKEVKNLYKKRWDIEEHFKHLKLREELENLSGKTTVSVLQDFHKMIFRANLIRTIASSVTKKEVNKINKKRKKTYQINWAQAARKGKLLLGKIIHTDLLFWLKSLVELKCQLSRQLEIVRPNRTNPISRRYTGRPVNFMAYKP